MKIKETDKKFYIPVSLFKFIALDGWGLSFVFCYLLFFIKSLETRVYVKGIIFLGV